MHKRKNIIYVLSMASLFLIPIVAVMKLVEGSVMLVDPRDPDSIPSCDDEICKHDLKIAVMDETLNLTNSTNLLVFPKTHY